MARDRGVRAAGSLGVLDWAESGALLQSAGALDGDDRGARASGILRGAGFEKSARDENADSVSKVGFSWRVDPRVHAGRLRPALRPASKLALQALINGLAVNHLSTGIAHIQENSRGDQEDQRVDGENHHREVRIVHLSFEH